MSDGKELLNISNLRTDFSTRNDPVRVLYNVSFTVKRDKIIRTYSLASSASA